MRKAMIAASVALVSMSTMSAYAADLRSGSMKDGPVDAYGHNWAGLYIGGSAGFGTGDTSGKIDIDDNLVEEYGVLGLVERVLQSDYDVNGAVYGAHVGYNIQRANIVFGLEAGINGTDMDGSATCAVIGYCQRELDWYGTGVARLGYASGNTLFYGFGGVAWGDVKTSLGLISPDLTLLDGEETHVGWTAGLGLEHAVNDRFSVRVEYSHVDLGEESTSLSYRGETIPFVKDDVDLSFDTIKIGASYKFTSGD